VKVTEPVPDAQAAARIFGALKGKAVITNGWADRYNEGSGVRYTGPANYTLIDDETYPSTSGKLAAFKNALGSASPPFIIVSGDIDLSDGKISDNDHSYYDQFDPATHKRINGDITADITSDTTLIGINNARIKYGGLRINNKTNVIIRNLTFYDAHGSTEYDTSVIEYADSKASIDALVIRGGSDGVWVDHCTFIDGVCEDLSRNYNHDGALDIPKGKNITVSWCEFTNHDKVMLVASSDSADNAVPEDRQITLHHNYFHDQVTQRMPRARGTQMHVYNNYYNNIGVTGNSGYSLGPGYGSQFIVENNYFGSHLAAIVRYFDKSQENDGTFSRFYHNGNIPALSASNCSYDGVETVRNFAKHETPAKPWVIPYIYTPDPAEDLAASIPAGAGSGLDPRKIAE
jgi:pectate lyase